MFDTAIIGAGPAGVSAALNLRLHNKSIIWFGSADMSYKLSKAEKIANYPGAPMISGAELNTSFRLQTEALGITVTDKKVTNIMPVKEHYMLLADNEVFEAKTVILAIGAVSSKGIEGEKELVGSGVSYCATCDGFLFKGKTVGVYCAEKRFEHEVKYLAEVAKKVYLAAQYDDCTVSADNIELLQSPIRKVLGEKRVTGIEMADGSTAAVDGVFFLRASVAPTALLGGLEMDGAHIAVDRQMNTNLSGCFAAGDCTGRPYQIAKAVGEGNVAAHSVLEYLSTDGK